MAIRNDIWLGSGSSVTFIPETDLRFKTTYTAVAANQGTYIGGTWTGSTATGNLIKMTLHADHIAEYSDLVANLYQGCTMDIYIVDVYDSSYIIKYNDADSFYIEGNRNDIATLSGATSYILIRGFGAPVPGPLPSGTTTNLLSDNWLGLVTSVSPPSVDIEMKQLNLALAGSRNWTYQYKGAHTISGVNLSLNANHGAWLYYALGACTNIAATNISPTVAPTSAFVSAVTPVNHDEFFYSATGGDQGPLFHRVIDGTTAFCPPLVDNALGSTPSTYERITQPTVSSGVALYPITYTLGESNTQTLPSFALEFAYQKGTELGSATVVDADSATIYPNEAIARIVTGNQINTLTLTADENMELTMSVDLSSKALVEPGANYRIMRQEYDENEFVNFGAPAGNQDTTTGFGKMQEFLTPFFFSEGSVKIWNTEYIRLQNVNLTINNTLTDKRFLGVSKKHKYAIPSQRTYEITFTGLVTDSRIFNELMNETATEGTTNQIELEFTKDNGEYIKLAFSNFMVTNNTWPIPEDKGPVIVEWTIQPLKLESASISTHWIIQ